MVGYQKKSVAPKGKERRVEFTRFALGRNQKQTAGVLYAKESKNCDLAGGKLRCGIGRSPFSDAYGAEKAITDATGLTVFSYRSGLHNYKHRLGYTNGGGGLFLYNASSGAFEDILGGGSDVSTFLGISGKKEVLLFVYGDEGGFVYTRSGTLTQLFSKKVQAGCFYGERAFFFEYPFALNYSKALEPENFEIGVEEGGKVELPVLRGKVHSFAPLNGRLYCFGEQGGVRLTAEGSALEFEVEDLQLGVSGIFKGSVRVCGEYIFFLTKEGLWKFDGNKVQRAVENLQILPKAAQTCLSASAHGNYYLQYTEEGGETRSLVVDGKGENGYFSFVKTALSDCEGRGLFLENGYAYQVDGRGDLPQGESYFFDAECDFGCTEEKTVKSLAIQGRGKVEFTFVSERGEKSFEVDLTDGEKQIPVKLKGKNFLLRIRLQAGGEIEKLGANVFCLVGS